MMTGQYQAALHSYAEGRYEEAMQQFSELLYEDPRNPKLHIWLGATFRKAGKMEYAKVQYQQVLTLTDDPDLLDLASTSLAQIQNKLSKANQKKQVSDRQSIAAVASPTLNGVGNPSQSSLRQVGEQVGASVKGDVDHFDDRFDEQVADKTIAVEPQSMVRKVMPVVSVNGNGKVTIPPPPVIVSMAQEYGQDVSFANENHLHYLDDQGKVDDVVDHEAVTEPAKLSESSEITEKAPTSFLSQAIASLTKAGQSIPRATSGAKKQKKDARKAKQAQKQPLTLKDVLDEQEPIASQPTMEHQASPVNHELIDSNAETIDYESDPAIADQGNVALEDLFKFSSIGQKLTLWGAMIATIPAIAIGVASYQVGYGLLLNRAKQEQQSETINLAKAANSFLAKQASDVEVMQKLLASSAGQNTLAKAPSKPAKGSANSVLSQQLNSRLTLYKQIYPQYSQLALFSPSGVLLATSPNAKNLPTLTPELLSKADTMDRVMLSKMVAKQNMGANRALYASIAIKNPASQKVSMILLAEISLDSLVNSLSAIRNTQGGSQFYLVDSNNKYVASSQPVNLGDDATVDFPMLSSLRSSLTEDLPAFNEGDRLTQSIAYAPVPSMATYGITTWDLITTVDKSSLTAGSQSLLLIVAMGIGVTPLLMALVAFLLSKNLSQRIREIRLALRDLVKGNYRNRIGLLIVEGNDELTDISISVNRMYEQFEVLMQKQEQEKQILQNKVVKLFQVLAKLAREDRQDFKNTNVEELSDERILQLGKKVRAEMIQHYTEVENYRQQKLQIKSQLKQMLSDMQALADGDLRISTNAVNNDLADVAIFFDDVLRGLQNIVSQVRSSANQVNFSLGQNEQAIANLASVSQRQVDIVSRSVNTLQLSVQSANEIIGDSRRIVESSQLMTEQVSNGDQAIDAIVAKVADLQLTVANTAKRVKHLGEASQKISKAISFVNEIAIQTNFLAINASLEASRDRGAEFNFVSVAEEVGELANRSIVATKEVEGLLGHIQQETNAVMAAVESSSHQVIASNDLAIAAKDNLHQLSTVAQQINELMTSISEATSAQVQTSEGVANLMQDISHIAQRTLASSEDAAKFIKATRNHTNDLQQSLAHFKV
jgi:twitching motility protein PilJ